MEIKGTITWYHTNSVMPRRNEYVLIETTNCKYPACVGFFNGVNWLSADDKSEILNVQYWAKINTNK